MPRVPWVFLAYRVPREPSTPRISVWRKLRRLGVAQVVDGLVALPLDARTREQLEWVADEVVEAGGEASIWLAEASSAAQERAMADGMAASIAEEYRVLTLEAETAVGEPPGQRSRTLGRLRRELRRIRARDFFPPSEAERARRAVDAFAEATRAALR